MKQTKFGKLRVLVLALLAMCMVFALTACRDDNSGSFKIIAQVKTVDVGKNIMISVATKDTVTWTSSNDGVAKVEQINPKLTNTARVTGVSVGTVTITATAGGKTANVEITVTAPEVISITKNGAAVSADIELSKNDTVQLAAASSKGHSIAWESSNSLIATVSDTGLVTAVATSGTATITAKCGGTDNGNGAIAATVTVKIGSGIDSAYEIEYAVTPATGKWTQWSEFDNVKAASYNDGEVMIDFVKNGARWVNIQLRYYPLESENLKQGQLYKLDFDADLEFHEGFEAASGHATINGNVVELAAGEGSYTVYYIQDEASFSMMMGWDDGTASGAWDLTDAKITLSNITWTPASAIPLVAPSFSIGEDGKIEITDTNPKGSVKSYILTLYNADNKIVGQVITENGKAINVSRIATNGTFTAKIKAIAASKLYTTSPEGAGESGADTVTVENESAVSYDLDFDPAVKLVGQWWYWSETWVDWTAKHYDGATDKVTATFSNNEGNWYDTQIFYKSCHAVGDKYTVKLHINVTADNVGEGKVTINNKVYNLVEGDNEITLTITETDGASITIVFGVVNQNKLQDIKAGTLVISVEEV